MAAELGERAVFAPADVTDEAAVSAALDAADGLGTAARRRQLRRHRPRRRHGARPGRPVLPLDAFERVVQVNLIGTFNVLRLAAARDGAERADRTSERGVIVNTASVAAFDGQIGQAAYSASKGGIVGMTLPIARDLARASASASSRSRRACSTRRCSPGCRRRRRTRSASRCRSRAGWAARRSTPRWSSTSSSNPMLNGETIRLDGAIRMAPR